MEDSKIGTREAIYLILTVAITHTIISTPRDLLANMKSAVLINIIYITFITLLIVLLVTKLFKRFPGLDILDISEYLGGINFKRLVGLVFFCLFIFNSGLLLKYFSEALKTIYYPMTNVIFIELFFIICIIITNKLNYTAIVKANLIIVPIALVSSIFLFTSNIKSFSFERIFPILGDGFYNIFILGLKNISTFTGISFLYFLPPLLKEPEKYKKLSIISVIIFFIYFLLTVSVILFMFSFLMNENEILALYSAARYIEIGTFFVRLESLFLLIWIVMFTSYFCIVAKASEYVLKKITNVKDSKFFVYLVALLILGIGLIKGNYANVRFYELNIYPAIVIGFNYIFCILLLLFANLKKKGDKNV